LHAELCLLRGRQAVAIAIEHARAEAEADERVALACLGAASRAVEEDVLITYVANARTRLAELGVALPAFETNRMRAF